MTKRTANIIAKPEHRIWSMRDPEALALFLRQSFPQLNLSQFVSEEVILCACACACVCCVYVFLYFSVHM